MAKPSGVLSMKKTPAWLGMCFLVSVCTVGGRGSQEKGDALALIQKARELSDIRAEGSPPFQLAAKVNTYNFKGKQASGSYSLVWKSSTEWREEIALAGYREVRVRRDDRVWTQRNAKFHLMLVYVLRELLDMKKHLTLRPDDQLVGGEERQKGGQFLDRLEVLNNGRKQRTLYFDTISHTLVRDHESQTADLSYEYLNYGPWNSSVYPGLMRAYTAKKVIAEVAIEELHPVPQPGSSLLAPPDGAEVEPACEQPEPAKSIVAPKPPYPPLLRMERVEGTVSFFVVIAKDGSVEDLAIIRLVDQRLIALTLQAVSQWRFKPATCHSVPVSSETIIDSTFTLAP